MAVKDDLRYFFRLCVNNFSHDADDEPNAVIRIQALHDRLIRITTHLDAAERLLSGTQSVVRIERAPLSDESRSLSVIAAALLIADGRHVEYICMRDDACRKFCDDLIKLLVCRCLEGTSGEILPTFVISQKRHKEHTTIIYHESFEGEGSTVAAMVECEPVGRAQNPDLIIVDDPALATRDWAASGFKTLVVVG